MFEKEKVIFVENREKLWFVEERFKIDIYWDGYVMLEDYIIEKGKLDCKKKEEVFYKWYVEKDEYG